MSVVCNLEFIKMTFQVRVKCLICRKLTDPTKGLEKETNAEDLKVVHNKLCAALKLEFSPKFQEWDFADEPFPYCESCGQRLQRLGELIDQLKSIQEEVDGSLATISSLIISSEKGVTNTSGPSSAPKLGHVKEYFRSLQEKHDYFRKLIIQRFDPRVNVERWDRTCNYNGGLSNENYNYELVPEPSLLNIEPEFAASPFQDAAAAAAAEDEAVFEEAESQSDTSANVTNGMEPQTISRLEPWTTSFSEAPTLILLSNKVSSPAATTFTFTIASDPGLKTNVPISLPPQQPLTQRKQTTLQYGVLVDVASQIYELNGFKFKAVENGYECCSCHHVSAIGKGTRPKRAHIKAHIELVHLGNPTSDSPHICKACGEVCPSNKTLDRHRILFHGSRKIQCGHCGVRFAYKSELERHVLTHSEKRERPYPCDQCGKRFYTREHRKTHILRGLRRYTNKTANRRDMNVEIPTATTAPASSEQGEIIPCLSLAQPVFEQLPEATAAEKAKRSNETEYKDHELVPEPCLINIEREFAASPFQDAAAAEEEAVFKEAESQSDTSANVTNSMEPEIISGLEPWTSSFSEAPTLTLVSNKVSSKAATTFTAGSDQGLKTNVPVSLPPQQFNLTFYKATKTYDLNGFKYKEVQGGYECFTCSRVFNISKQHFKMVNIHRHIKTVHMGIRSQRKQPTLEDGIPVDVASQIYELNGFKFKELETGYYECCTCRHVSAISKAKGPKIAHIKAHIELVHLGNPTSDSPSICKACGEVCITPTALQRHRILFHRDIYVESPAPAPSEQGGIIPCLSLAQPVFEQLPGSTPAVISNETEYKVDTHFAGGVEPETIIGLEETWTSLTDASTLTLVSDQVENPAATSTSTSANDPVSGKSEPSTWYVTTFNKESKTYETNGFQFKELENGSCECCLCGHVTAIPTWTSSKRENINRHIKAVHTESALNNSSQRVIERYDEASKTGEIKGFKFKELGNGSYMCCTCGHVSAIPKGNCKKQYIIQHIVNLHVGNVVKSGSMVCKDCGAAFTTFQALFAHRARTHLPPKFPCDYCGATFLHQFSLSCHVKRMHLKSLKCAECGKSFYKKEHLEFHSWLHAKKRALRETVDESPTETSVGSNDPGSTEFRCGHCGAKFPFKSALESHVITHAAEEGKSGIISDFGNMSNGKKHSRKQSLRMHPGRSIVEPVFVGLAGTGTTEEEQLFSETNKHNMDTSSNVAIAAGEPETIIGLEKAWAPMSEAPPLPLYLVSTAEDGGEHRNWTSTLPTTVFKPGQKVCKECGEFFASVQALYRHYGRIHRSLKFQCGHCGAKFKSQRDLTRHMMRHSEKKPYRCDECDKSFTKEREFVVHSGMHIRKRAMEDINAENPTTTFPINTDALVWVNEDPPDHQQNFEETIKLYQLGGFKYRELENGSYECCTCGHVSAIPRSQRPRQRSLMQQHIKAVHMGIRKKIKLGPRKCEECGELCSSMETLYTHRIRVHLPPRFQCGHCGVKFPFKMDLNRHAVTHNENGVRPYSCEQCDKSFFTKSHLKTHSTVHSSERPEKCSACGLKFKRRHDLRRHIRLIHAKDRKPVPSVAESEIKVDPDSCGNEGQ